MLSRNKAEDIELYILTTFSFSTWNIKEPEKIRELDVAYEQAYGIRIIRNRHLFARGEKIWIKDLLKTLRQIKPDVVYSHGVEYLSFMRLVLSQGARRRTRLVTDTHSLPQFTSGSLFRRAYYFFIRQVIARSVNRNRILTFYTAEENYRLLTGLYGISKDLVKPFLIGADLTTFHYDPKAREEIRLAHKLGKEDILILFTGRLCLAKGPHLLTRALGSLTAEWPGKLHVLMIGFPDESYMKTFSQEFAPSGKYGLSILPPVPARRLRDYFSAADFAVYPTETTLSSLESQACRCPVIMEDNPTNRERCREGGLLYRPSDPADLAGKIRTLITDPVLREKLAHAGSRHIEQRYNYLENIRSMEQELRNQADKARPHDEESEK